MIGTILNVAAILVGGALGMLFGARLPDRVSKTVVAGMGLFTLAIGIQMAVKMQQPLVVLGSLLIGGILGEWWRLEDRLRSLGAWLEKRFAGGGEVIDEAAAAAGQIPAEGTNHGSRFIRGFLTASLVYVIGPMAILGSIQDGLTGDFNLLAIKSVLDGFASLAFASSLGIGVLFSALVVGVYQGAITLLAAQAKPIMDYPIIVNEMTALGGVLLIGVALSGLLEIKPIRVGNFLPGLFIAPVIMGVLLALGLVH